MNAHKLETTLAEDGTLTLQGLPFQAGESVEVIILSLSPEIESKSTPPSSFWQSLQQFRLEVNLDESEIESDVFAEVRDKSPGREVVL